jgi:ribosome-interacting GTPase 1
MEQAREYKSLLEANDIPATISQHDEHAIDSKEIAVMVSEEFLDEAHVVIESQHAYDDFYDFAMEDESESDFDEDFLEDDY